MPKPTKTEQLLYGKTGASDPLDPFRLERDLIGSDKWSQYYDKMHQTVREVVDNFRNPDFDPFSYGCSVGVGFNEEVGLFVLGTGQGPFVMWTEDDGYVDLLAASEESEADDWDEDEA
jgi:hypothetical protein